MSLVERVAVELADEGTVVLVAEPVGVGADLGLAGVVAAVAAELAGAAVARAVVVQVASIPATQNSNQTTMSQFRFNPESEKAHLI